MKDKYMELMLSELKLTMGCTDIGAVAFAAAAASSVIQGDILSISVLLSPMIYKNALHVAIPHIKRSGIGYAAIFGALINNPEKKLAILNDITPEIIDKYESIKKQICVSVDYVENNNLLYIEVECIKLLGSERNIGKAIIKGSYDRIQTIYKNNEIIYHEDKQIDREVKSLNLTIEEIYKYISNMNYETVKLLFESEEINKKATNKSKKTININKNLSISDLSYEAGEWVFDASKKRMSGEAVNIVSLCGSGNLGITTLLPVSCITSYIGNPSLERGKSLALAILTAIYMKSKMNIVTTVCGSALAGACGVSAAVAYLYGGNLENINNAINTSITAIFGVLCDGAKESCTFKVSSAVRNAVIIGYNSVKGIHAKEGEGIIYHDINDTINVISKLNNISMDSLEKKILENIKSNV
jgi:L-cysteine desulfidase